jgi:hypothetical protein
VCIAMQNCMAMHNDTLANHEPQDSPQHLVESDHEPRDGRTSGPDAG